MKAQSDKRGPWVRPVAVAAALLVLLSSAGCQMAGGGGRTFAVAFGGARADHFNCVEQTPDGGYIAAGCTKSYGTSPYYDAWLVKADPSGREVWYRTFGGERWEEAHSVWPTRDGGYILAGATGIGYGYDWEAWLIKTNASGEQVWTQVFRADKESEAYCVRETRDGGYIVAGSYDQDAWVMKTDPTGKKIWSRTFGENDLEDEANCVQEMRDGGYIVAGSTESLGAGGTDGLLIRLDPTGRVIWSRTFGGPDWDSVDCVQETRDRGLILAGGTESWGAGKWDAWLIRTDASGNEVWSRTFGGPDRDSLSSTQQTRDGGYIVVGRTLSFGAGNYDVWLIKVDRSGEEAWSRTFGDRAGEYAGAVLQTRDGGYIIAGATVSETGNIDGWLIKTDSKGEVRSGP